MLNRDLSINIVVILELKNLVVRKVAHIMELKTVEWISLRLP